MISSEVPKAICLGILCLRNLKCKEDENFKVNFLYTQRTWKLTLFTKYVGYKNLRDVQRFLSSEIVLGSTEAQFRCLPGFRGALSVRPQFSVQ